MTPITFPISATGKASKCDGRHIITKSVHKCPLWEAKRTLLGERVMSAPDPKRTWAGSKSRSATVSCRAIVCYAGSTGGPAAPAPIQNNSGLAQGLACLSAAG